MLNSLYGCAFIFHSQRSREGIMEKGGKMSGVGGISRARSSGVPLSLPHLSLSLCLSLFRIRAYSQQRLSFYVIRPRATRGVTRKTDDFARVFTSARRTRPTRRYPLVSYAPTEESARTPTLRRRFPGVKKSRSGARPRERGSLRAERVDQTEN